MGREVFVQSATKRGDFRSGLVRATLKGTTLYYVGDTLSDDCYNDYIDVVNPFIAGKTNTLFYGKQGNAVVGPNLWCPDGGRVRWIIGVTQQAECPTRTLVRLSDPYGAAVSIAK